MVKEENKSTNQTSKDGDSTNSICGILKDNSSELIQKLESEMPSVFQGYSDLYSRYLHSVQDIFATCNVVEKQYFDKMGVDQNILKMFNDCLKYATNVSESQIELYTNFMKIHMQFRLSSIDSWDKYAHIWTDMYGKYFSELLKRYKVI